MNNNQYTYNQPPMGQMMTSQMPRDQRSNVAPKPRTRQERWMRRLGMDVKIPLVKGERIVPNWLTGKSMVFFFVAMFACWGAFGYVPEFALWADAAVSVVVFFYGASSMSNSWRYSKTKKFVRNVFIAAFAIRVIWILYCYFVFNPEHYGTTFGITADVEWYMPFGKDLAQWISNGFDLSFEELRKKWVFVNDDFGYPMWLGIIYWIVGVDNDVFIPFVIKSLMSAYCAVSIYNIAKRHYGEGVARMAAIFVALNPNMIFWCGTMFKEIELVFLCCLAVDNFDRVLSSGQKYTFRSLLPGIAATTILMFFRGVLGILIFLAVTSHIVFVSNRIMSTGKKILAGVLVMGVLFASVGDRLLSQSQELLDRAQSGHQEVNMEWRAERDGGNSFAKYAGAAVFAPLIFTLPFPTFNTALEAQLLQIQLSGGSYIKNILSFFVIMVMLMMLISGEWRRHVFVLAYTVGYHVVLVMSEFAHSGRFHMPVIPFLMLFAAYGIQIAKTNPKMRKWFPLVLVVEVMICLVWNWFKLKGRGMI